MMCKIGRDVGVAGGSHLCVAMPKLRPDAPSTEGSGRASRELQLQLALSCLRDLTELGGGSVLDFP